MSDDPTLLRRYATDRAEDAFAEFVRRNLPLVYSAALRRLGGDARRAEDVAQTVFCSAARHAGRLAQHAALTGWLYTATRHAVIDTLRTEQRRRNREQEAQLMHEISSPTAPEAPADWTQLHPVLDDVMDELPAADREAVLLRFFQSQPFAAIGATLGLSEDAARKRVDRALEKLRAQLARRGIASTATALAALLAGEAIAATPASLAASITGAALAGGGTAAGAAVFMSVSKLWIGLGAAAVLGGTAGLISQQHTIAGLRESSTALQQHVIDLSAENARRAAAQTAAEAELAKLRLDRVAAKTTARETPRAPSATAPLSVTTAPNAATLAAQKQQELERERQRIAPFARQRNLTPEQAEKLAEILSDWGVASSDFQASIREQGLTATPEAQKLRDHLQQQIEVEPLIALLGPGGDRAYFDFEGTLFYRAIAQPFTEELATRNLPLTDDQTTRLLGAVKANLHSVKRDPTAMGSEAVIDWPSVLAAAGSFLDPQQLSLMQSLAARRNSGSAK